MTFAEIAACFESLGDNCEFGLVQRAAGIEPLGFFRFSFSHLTPLLRGLDCRFADLDGAGSIEIYTEPPPSRELMVRVRGYGFQYHTDRNVGEVDVEELWAQQVRAVGFLTRKLLDDLRSGEKIFVRKGEDSTHPEQVIPLFEALRRHGPATLLWVVVADDAHPCGTVEVLRPGLLKGYIDRFAPYAHAHALSDVWIDICHAAHELWRADAAPGTVVRGAASEALRAQYPRASLAALLQAQRTARARPASAPLPTVRYMRLALEEVTARVPAMADGRPRAERWPLLPAVTLTVPPFAFATSATIPPAARDAVRKEAAGRTLQRPALSAWLLRNALVHGTFGIVTIDDTVVRESAEHLPLHLIPGSSVEDDTWVRLPDTPSSATLPAAYHLLACHQDNYYHWMVDALSRWDPAQFAAFGSALEAPGAPLLLVSNLDMFWKWETLNALVPHSIPRVALTNGGRAFVQRLLYVPDLSGGGAAQHPAMLRMYDAIAAEFRQDPTVRPWRRIYVARTDSRNRALANETEVMARAERDGFTPVVLSRLSIAEQVRLFAEASHILAPHGAGLINIGFCHPGAKLCELQMDGYLHWAFRRLAALRGMHYGCLVGERIGPAGPSAHTATWRIDPDAIDAVLRDPAFVS